MAQRKSLKPECGNSHAEIVRLCQVLDDVSDFFEDFLASGYQAKRIRDKCHQHYGDLKELNRLAERIVARCKENEKDIREFRDGCRRAIADFEHIHGPVFYDKNRRVFEYHIEVGQPIELSVKPSVFRRIEQDDGFPY